MPPCALWCYLFVSNDSVVPFFYSTEISYFLRFFTSALYISSKLLLSSQEHDSEEKMFFIDYTIKKISAISFLCKFFKFFKNSIHNLAVSVYSSYRIIFSLTFVSYSYNIRKSNNYPHILLFI